ncbi:hypothetical protein ABG79_00416 [Caloramator mitchellensis]|uniref:Uncharacterized protein n=1 Tax=Caloramator mitchellensis TaxID=908809 RepID=A0A0R3K5H0_CALMK|nr:hypothetical protein [Caloramator mitchellensis]KRQ87615.1 hypothetical protein ABG79_00416 [Caloramator mitchellensis]
MKFKKSITILVFIIVLLSSVAALTGIFSGNGQNAFDFKSLNGHVVKIYGDGLYKNDSVSIVSQGKAQDIITMILGIPLLIYSLYSYRKGYLKGKLLLSGTLGYFLYTYVSYTFLSMYNRFFLIYVALMSSSLFAFIISIMSIDIEKLPSQFNKKLPVKLLSSLMFLIAFILGIMWLGLTVPTALNETIPPVLEHYTTLVIQAMDLGFIVPVSIIAGLLLLKQKPFGYLLTSIMIIKGLTMGTALTAMIIGQIMAGVAVPLPVIVIFPFLNIFIVYCLYKTLSNVVEARA